MIPLAFSKPGESGTVNKVSGSAELKSHLEHMGFVPGAEVRVVSVLDGNVIVNVKNTRIAISKEMASKIMI